MELRILLLVSGGICFDKLIIKGSQRASEVVHQMMLLQFSVTASLVVA